MPPHRIVFLDGLRGVAATLVLLGHLLDKLNDQMPTATGEWLLGHVGLGRVGVIAFFLISGFVIPFSFRPVDPVRNFIAGRFFRLYPAFWVSLALAVVLAGGMASPAVLANLTMAPAVLGQPDAIGVYWTLFIELLFYGVCLGMFMTGLLHRTSAVAGAALGLWAVSAASALAAYYNAPLQPSPGIPGYLGIMFLGTVWRRAWLEEEAAARRAMPVLLFALALAIPVVGLLGFEGNMPARPLADFLGVYLGLALFFGAFLFRAPLERAASAWLGKISYSLYLLHPLAMIVSVKVAALTGSPVALLITVPLALLMAEASYRFVELPSVQLGKLVARTIRSRSVPALA